MAEKKTDAEVQPNDQQQEPVKEPTQRERYTSRRREAYPDISEDDEDAYYGQANADLDELEGYRKSNKELADVFDKTPTLAGMLLAGLSGSANADTAALGVLCFPSLKEAGYDDLDIRELINDPDFGTKIAQALDKYQENQLKGQQAQAEIKANYQASFAALKEIQQERGMSDEECLQLVDDFFENVIGNASKGIVSKETWEAYLKARNYDADIATAREQASAQALNSRIQNPKKNFDEQELPPTLSTGGAGAGEPEGKKKSRFFDDWEREEGM